jgi:hypothetical protein
MADKVTMEEAQKAIESQPEVETMSLEDAIKLVGGSDA